MSASVHKSVEFTTQNANGDLLFIKHFASVSGKGQGIVLIHGSVENGRVFYSNSGKGPAPYLASQGYEVFVPDLRGRGKSSPLISSSSRFGNLEIIQEDFPLYEKVAREFSSASPLIWMGHSWGGVLIYQAIFRKCIQQLFKVVCWGSKRRISVYSLKRLVMIEVFWVAISKILIRLYGYLPADKWRIGSDNESASTHSETNSLVHNPRWIDPVDRFDYTSESFDVVRPPALFLTGQNDDVLGHQKDVKLFMDECGYLNEWPVVCGKQTGFQVDYGHINLLTDPHASKEVFPMVLSWLTAKNDCFADFDPCMKY